MFSISGDDVFISGASVGTLPLRISSPRTSPPLYTYRGSKEKGIVIPVWSAMPKDFLPLHSDLPPEPRLRSTRTCDVYSWLIPGCFQEQTSQCSCDTSLTRKQSLSSLILVTGRQVWKKSQKQEVRPVDSNDCCSITAG
ncbi:hypothetical protein F2P81_023819 [Scophthalmus maximus]|uniref:Uncharacterized protein n=1 Tax=Scophthalmus maximus TaxID=52904 RepID=A0A6A4RSC1_SCOMX|nr:hypothetical protein F2P81_023819 [Scophthalmus maximus]